MSEVTSTAMVDEKEQISVPKELFHDFESLKNATNLTTVDLMRKLLGEYQTFDNDGIQNDMDALCPPRMTTSPNNQRGEMAKADEQCPQILDGITQSERHVVEQKSLGRHGRKGGIPGQKLKQVCEILHCKRAAKELAKQRRQENSDRNCNSAGSSSSGTLGCFEETNFTNVESFSRTNDSPFSHPRIQTQQVPLAHTSGTQDAVNIRKILGTRVNKAVGLHPFEAKGNDESVLDLSVKKCNGAPALYDYSETRQSFHNSDTIYDHTPVTTMDSTVFGMQNYAALEKVSTLANIIQQPPGYMYSNSGTQLAVLTENKPQTRTAQGMPPQLSAQYEETQNPRVMYITQGAQPSSSGPLHVLETSRMRTRTRKPTTNKPASQEMKLISENSLFPGIYTSTFKLPGSRRGRRSTAAKQAAAQASAAKNSRVDVNTATNHPNAVLPVQPQVGHQQPYMMLCPQVAMSSVLVKTPRKRGRPPKRPNIAQFQQSFSQQPTPSPVVFPQSQMEISLPGSGTPGLISSDNGAVSYLYKAQSEQQVTLQNQPLTNSDNASTQVHPNHSQLMNILNHATSINACNPIFVPNSSLQSGVPTALPTNASGVITLPLQQLQTEGTQLIQPSHTNMQASVFIKQDLSPDSSETISNILHEAPAQPTYGNESSSIVKLEGSPDSLQNVILTQEMILSKQALVSVKPRTKLTTTELIRSNSNFYCGSFKIRPQKPSTTSGHGVPIKRGRGRPKLNVVDSRPCRQKETIESQAKMYQELYHCKICNDIVSSDDRFSHQRKHIGVKVRCTTCGVEYEESHSMDSSSQGTQTAQCSQCKKIFGSGNITTGEKCAVSPDETEADSSVMCVYEDATQNESLDNPTDLISSDDVRYSDDTCHVCNKVCSTAVELARHLEQHPGHQLTCTEDGCHRTFGNGSELRRHRKHIHGKGREHTCEYDGCDKKFLKNFHLQEHIRVKHFNIKAFKCHWPGCRKEFAGIRHLKVHMLIHKDEKPLKCKLCDYRCRQRNALNWHMRRHAGVSFVGTEGACSTDSDDPEERDMVIDLSLQEDDCSVEELSPLENERENGEIDSEHESYSSFIPVVKTEVLESDSVEILEKE